MKALLSIKPTYVNQIMSGEKKYEYRKKIFRRNVESVVVYASMPVGKIVGEFEIEKIINNTPIKVWSQTKEYAGVSYKFFSQYFKNKKEAYAIQIKEFKPYENPIDPYATFENFIPPQSFKYIDD